MNNHKISYSCPICSSLRFKIISVKIDSKKGSHLLDSQGECSFDNEEDVELRPGAHLDNYLSLLIMYQCPDCHALLERNIYSRPNELCETSTRFKE